MVQSQAANRIAFIGSLLRIHIYIYHIYRTYTHVVAIVATNQWDRSSRMGLGRNPHPAKKTNEKGRRVTPLSQLSDSDSCCRGAVLRSFSRYLFIVLLLSSPHYCSTESEPDVKLQTRAVMFSRRPVEKGLGGRTARNRIKGLELSRGERRSTAGNPSSSANRANAASQYMLAPVELALHRSVLWKPSPLFLPNPVELSSAHHLTASNPNVLQFARMSRNGSGLIILIAPPGRILCLGSAHNLDVLLQPTEINRKQNKNESAERK